MKVKVKEACNDGNDDCCQFKAYVGCSNLRIVSSWVRCCLKDRGRVLPEFAGVFDKKKMIEWFLGKSIMSGQCLKLLIANKTIGRYIWSKMKTWNPDVQSCWEFGLTTGNSEVTTCQKGQENGVIIENIGLLVYQCSIEGTQ